MIATILEEILRPRGDTFNHIDYAIKGRGPLLNKYDHEEEHSAVYSVFLTIIADFLKNEKEVDVLKYYKKWILESDGVGHEVLRKLFFEDITLNVTRFKKMSLEKLPIKPYTLILIEALLMMLLLKEEAAPLNTKYKNYYTSHDYLKSKQPIRYSVLTEGEEYLAAMWLKEHQLLAKSNITKIPLPSSYH